MSEKRKPDFSGWATKIGLKCSDGRTIMPDAFKHQDQMTVPLVWQHNHDDPGNVLGHAVLEARPEGIYTYGYFNGTDQAVNARELVEHRDITSLSIYANQLTEKAKQVFHGVIREVSLVLSGANPGAMIDNVTLAHSDGRMETLENEAVIYTGEELEHGDQGEKKDPPADPPAAAHASTSEDDGPTVKDVYDGMTEEQQSVVHFMVGEALKDRSAEHSDDTKTGDLKHEAPDDEKDGRQMAQRNVFEQKDGAAGGEKKHTLTHDALKGIVEDAQRGGSLKEAFESYALKHGIENIELLFPEAKNVTTTPEWDTRRMAWVSSVLSGTKKAPFSRIKSMVADLTFEAARAKGYIKGNLKKEEFFGVAKRTTTPTTIYKKQKLDRDDIIDITDFDVVVWLKGEMRMMLDEEIARAILVGDGREVMDEDKIRDPMAQTDGIGIRSIANEHDLYAATITVNIDDALSTPIELVDAIVRGMNFYKGSGSPTFYTTLPTLTYMLLHRDQFGHRMWSTAAELAAELNVASIVTVEVMEDTPDLVGIIVNLNDYTVGTDRGGEVNFFDDFDIDYNQYKYLYETRMSGALTRIRSALVIRRADSTDTLVVPTQPGFVPATGVVTIPTITGVTYKNFDTDATLTPGAQAALAPGAEVNIIAVPSSGAYYFADNQNDEWTFERDPA